MPWNKVVLWVILLVVTLMSYVTYLHLAPMGLATATEAETSALTFKKQLTNQPRFTKKRIATTTIATSIAISTTFASVMFSTSKTRPDHDTESPTASCA